MTDNEISLYRGKQLLKSETDKRVSRDAAEALNKDVEEYGVTVSEKALEFTNADGRKTVRAVDIRKALREVNR